MELPQFVAAGARNRQIDGAGPAATGRRPADGNPPGTNFAKLIDSSGNPPVQWSSQGGIFCDKGDKLQLNRLLTITFRNEKDHVQASL
jgi:hypothetical protein